MNVHLSEKFYFIVCQIFSPVILDILGFRDLTDIAQFFSYMASGIVTLISGIFLSVKFYHYLKMRK